MFLCDDREVGSCCVFPTRLKVKSRVVLEAFPPHNVTLALALTLPSKFPPKASAIFPKNIKVLDHPKYLILNFVVRAQKTS